MVKLKHKNLMVDDEKVRKLARLTGTSESEAVRQAVRRWSTRWQRRMS